LESAIRTQDTDKVCDSLEKMREIGKQPRVGFLKKLGETRDLPDRLYVELKNWRTFGYISKNIREFTPPMERPNKEKNSLNLINFKGTKRIKMK